MATSRQNNFHKSLSTHTESFEEKKVTAENKQAESTDSVIEIKETPSNIQTVRNITQQLQIPIPINNSRQFLDFIFRNRRSISILIGIGMGGPGAAMLFALIGGDNGFLSDKTANVVFFTAAGLWMFNTITFSVLAFSKALCPQAFSSLPLLNRFFSRNTRISDLARMNPEINEAITYYNSRADLKNEINENTPLAEALRHISNEEKNIYSDSQKVSLTLFKTLTYDKSSYFPHPVTKIIADYVVKDEEAVQQAEAFYKPAKKP